MDNKKLADAYQSLNKLIINLLDSFSALSSLSAIDLRLVDEPTLLQNALKGLIQNLDMNSCSVFLLQNDKLVNSAGLDWNDLLNDDRGQRRPIYPMTAPAGEGIMGLAVRGKRLQHCRDCSADPNFRIQPENYIGSLISVPIVRAGGEVLGVLNISHSEPFFFSEWHERFLLIYCNSLGQLLVSHRLLNHMDLEVGRRTRQLKQVLEETEAKGEELRLFKTIIESSQEAVAIRDAAGRLMYINPSYERLFGQSLEEARRHDCHRQVNSDMAEMFRDPSGNGKDGTGNWEGEIEACDAAGRRIPLWKQTGSVLDPNGEVLYSFDFMRDISKNRQAEEEKRSLETKLNHSQKMEAIGQLAGGIAHDFNNILTTIIGYGHIMLMRMDENDPLRVFVSQIMSSSERATSLTQSLLAFSRKQIIKPQLVNINEVIGKIDRLLLRLIREDIEFRTMLTESKLVVMADVGQLEQVFMNLATNARDAMPEGGLLTISTNMVELDRDFVQANGFGKQGRYACITVADTGVGMDDKTRGKIFEPFFTTKEVGKGTGLGLAMAYGAIKQQNGYITVQSEVGRGTVFKIYLPLAGGRPNDKGKTAYPFARPGAETLLIAEDDADVRLLDKALLEEYGYKVYEAVDGRDALEKFREHRAEIDLLILDVVMPKMNGKEVYDEIRRMNPCMKVLFTSGYTADIIHRKGIMEQELNFIAKPVPPSDFLRKVREILDKEL